VVSARALYRTFLEGARAGDIRYFVERIVATSTREGIARNRSLIAQLARIYDEPNARRVLPRLAAALKVKEHQRLSTTLGTDSATDKEVCITLPARFQGVYCIGATGTGKTTLLLNMILSDIHLNRGICLIEPHGDLTRQVIAAMPEQRLEDVIYLDLADSSRSFGLNFFQCEAQAEVSDVAKVASFVMHVFEKVWAVGPETPRLAQVLRNTTRVLIENPGMTFAEIPLLLWDDQVREKFVRNVTNIQTKLFWQQYNRKAPRDREELIASTINKCDSYLNEPLVARIVSQSASTIDFRQIMDEGKILLVNLSPQLEEPSRLVGAVILGRLLMAAFSRSDTPEEGERRPFMIYADEYQRYATSDFATLLAEARKFNIGTFLSNQALEQLDDLNRATALQAGTLVVFRVSGEDSRTLSKSFDTTPTQPYVIGEEAIRAPTNDTINFLLRKAHTNPAAMACNRYLEYLLHFAGFTVPLPPVHTPRGHFPNSRGSKAESVLEGMGDAVAVMLCNFSDRRKYRKAQGLVTDAQHCILILNEYFAEIMLRRDPTLPIPQEVSTLFGRREFCNGNVGDFLASLQAVVAALAQAPILVETGQYRPRLQSRMYSDMEGEIANALANQENYHARVKLLTSEHVIKTQRPPRLLTEHKVQERIRAIKQRMLLYGYTRPATAVEEEVRKRHEALRQRPPEVPPPTHTPGRRGRGKPPEHT
jgi:hypothetical protein